MKILIAVPCFDMVHSAFVRSLMELDRPAGTAFTMIQNTLIYTARNLIAQNAVKMGFDAVLWIDSDMTLPRDALTMLAADLAEGRDYVTGLYFTRKPPILPCVHKELHWNVKDDGWVDTGAKCYVDYPKNEIFEIACSGFGCCMTSTALLKRMLEKYGGPFFPLMGMGEDTAFCYRATQDGEKLWCDSRVKCGHVGQYEFDENAYLEV